MTPPAGTEPLRGGVPPAAAEAEGRARAYALLADLAARGPTAASLAAARCSPLLAAALPEGPGGALDLASADHQRVLGMEALPFEGVYLDAAGAAGGEAAGSLGDLYRRCGFPPDAGGEGPEHLATLLRALAFLSGAEADALADGLPAVADRVRTLARELLDGHLLRWLPPLAVAVRGAGAPFPSALVDQVVDLVALHREGLGPLPASVPPLPDPALDLDDPETGLEAIAALLARPARAGVLLTRGAVARAARGAGLPRGFGDRATEIGNLLRAAGHLDGLDGALEALDREVAAAAPAGAGPFDAPWAARARGTRELLASLGRRAAARP